MRNVNKHKVRVYLLISLFLILLSTSILVSEAESISGSVIKIVSPTSSTYNCRVLLLNVTFTYGGLRYDLTYNLDRVTKGSIPMGEYRSPDNEVHLINTVYAWVNLPELSDGPHSVTVTLVASLHYGGGGKPNAVFQPISPGSSEYSATWSDTVQFSVCADEPYEKAPQPVVETIPLEISNLSVHNQTYLSSDIPLNFTLKGSTSRIAYTLDGCENVTIDGNITLHGLSTGKHTLTIFCWNGTNNVEASKTVDFAIIAMQKSETQSESSLILPVAASVASIGVVAVAIMVYLKKRKPPNAGVVKNS